MNILYTCDDNYIWLMGISMISLFETNRDAAEIQVYLLGDKISPENRERLQTIASSYGRQVAVSDVGSLQIPEALCSSRWPRSAFIRLFAGKLLPDTVDRILYIDCDTLVCGSLEEIYRTPMEENVLCAVRDCVSWRYIRNIGGDTAAPYYNAGVLLMDAARLRGIDVESILANYIEAYRDGIYYADQDVLNGAFSGRIGSLPARANMMTLLFYYDFDEIGIMRRPNVRYSREEYASALEDPAIVHFTTCMTILRPWYQGADHPWAEAFLRYKAMSPWADKPVTGYTFSGKKNLLLAFLRKLPRKLSVRCIGFLHAFLVPFLQGLGRSRHNS